MYNLGTLYFHRRFANQINQSDTVTWLTLLPARGQVPLGVCFSSSSSKDDSADSIVTYKYQSLTNPGPKIINLAAGWPPAESIVFND